MGTLTSIAFNKLRLCPNNIRKSSPNAAAEHELKASIESHGVIVSLIVVKQPRGLFNVIAGARRFNATAQLVAEKKLPKDYPMPCYVLGADENPEEAALIENTLRAAMHPVDEFESYHRLHFTQHLSVDDIAARFGKPGIEIKQRLALGAVLPALRIECREGNLSLESLSAYTLGADWEAQERCYKALQSENFENRPWKIREYFAKQFGYHSNHRLVKLVGMDAYTAAGGRFTRDLFSTDAYLHDAHIIDQLLKELLEKTVEKLQQDGWSWVDIDLEHFNKPLRFADRVIPSPSQEEIEIDAELEILEAKASELQDQVYELDESETEQIRAIDAQIHEVEDKVAELELRRNEAAQRATYTPEQLSTAGCVVTLGGNGELIIEKGYVKTVKATARNESADQSADAPQEQATLSQALTDDLRSWNQCTSALELFYSGEYALDLVLFSVAWSMLADGTVSLPPLSITTNDPYQAPSVEDQRGQQARDELLSSRSSLNLSWLRTSEPGASLHDFIELPQVDKRKILAWCAARTLNSTMIEQVKTDIGAKLAKHWRPTTANFFSRAPRELLLQYGAEISGDEDYPHLHRIKPRKDLAILLNQAVAEMPITDCWLPPMLRTSKAVTTSARP